MKVPGRIKDYNSRWTRSEFTETKKSGCAIVESLKLFFL